jgi:hypothetical protein
MFPDYLVAMEGTSLIRYCLIFPKAGIMRNGKLYQLEKSVRVIYEKEFGLWPTPIASDSKRMRFKKETLMKNHKRGRTLIEVFVAKTGNYPSSIFVEAMMGYPKNWTDINASVMPLSLSVRKR